MFCYFVGKKKIIFRVLVKSKIVGIAWGLQIFHVQLIVLLELFLLIVFHVVLMFLELAILLVYALILQTRCLLKCHNEFGCLGF